MKRLVIKRQAAKRDLDENAAFLGKESPDVAIRFLEAAEKSFLELAAMPDLGRECDFENPAFKGMRRWLVRGFQNYLILYRPIPKGIEIIRVLHGARDIEAIFEA